MFFSQRDDRGTIDRLRVGGKRINLLFSKTGVMRSGYLHPETKYGFVVSGEVEVWILTNKGTDKKVGGGQGMLATCAKFLHVLISSLRHGYTVRFTRHKSRLSFLPTFRTLRTF